MSRNRHLDIEIEVIELCNELKNEIRQQLSYFRASVYKDETANIIRNKIDKLRVAAELFADEAITEPFKDYEAELQNSIINVVPGECSFTSRVTRLLGNLEEQLNLNAQRNSENSSIQSRVRKKKKEILSMCRHGSRQWTFFQRI